MLRSPFQLKGQPWVDNPDSGGYSHADLLAWIEDVRRRVLQDRVLARLPYDRYFIAGMAQGLPELCWCVATAQVERINPSHDHERGARAPILVPDSHREVGLVMFEGKLLCPKGQPDTIVHRLLKEAMTNTVPALDGCWNDTIYRLACVKIKTIARRNPSRKAVGPALLGPALLNTPAAQVIEMFQEHRARHLDARRLGRITPPAPTQAQARRI